jgi:transglutaminase/protease-like cytokinesis protein 3
MKNIIITKKITAFALLAVLSIALCSCSQNNNGTSGAPSAMSSSSSSEQTAGSTTPQSSIPAAADATSPSNTPSSTAGLVPVQTDVQMESLWYYYNMLDSSQKAAYLELYDAIQAWISNDSDTQPFTYELRNPGSTVNGNDILMDMKWDNPIIAQYFNTVTVKEASDLMVFTDTDDQHTFGNTQDVRQAIRDAEAAGDVILSGLSSSMSDYDKYWYIAKKLCEETAYDYAFPQVSMRQFLDDSGVYGALVSHLSICQGFAQTYDYLCKRAGLFSLVISGNTSSGDHAWNVIKLDDGYYHVDTTWMQLNEDRYFCLTDKQIAVDHTIISVYHPKCDGSKYAYQGSLD